VSILEKSYLSNGAVIEVLYQKDDAESGFCVSASGRKTALTKEELLELEDLGSIECK
jgi:hypothetical protein